MSVSNFKNMGDILGGKYGITHRPNDAGRKTRCKSLSDYGELLRTIGFSSSPGVLRFFGIIPMLGNILNLICSIWMLVAMIKSLENKHLDPGILDPLNPFSQLIGRKSIFPA
jgi:hypothetical protein